MIIHDVMMTIFFKDSISQKKKIFVVVVSLPNVFLNLTAYNTVKSFSFRIRL